MTDDLRVGDVAYRHGDIVLIVAELPAHARRISADGEPIVLAVGEATGHAHTVTGTRVALWSADEQRYLVAESTDVALDHQEHGHVPVQVRTYFVGQEREYTDDQSERRTVD